MKPIFYTLLASCLCAISAAQITADSALIQRARAEKDFEEAKTEYAQFEKEHGHYLQTKNGKIHYLTYGKPQNTPLLWSGGSGTNAYELILCAGEQLSQMGYYLICVDYYGQGRTPIPSGEVSLWHVADDMNEILKSLKIKKAVIGGWSRGGTITTVFYDTYPEKVLALILEDGGSVSWNANDHKLSIAEIEERNRKRFSEEKPEQVFDSTFDAFYAEWPKKKWYRLFVMNGINTDSTGKWAMGKGLDHFYCEDNAENKLKITLRTMDAPLYAASAQLVEPRIIYRNLAVPMLILDPVSDPEEFDFLVGNTALQKMHPELIEHKVYAKTNHALKFQRKDMFLKDMEDFLKRIKTFHQLK